MIDFGFAALLALITLGVGKRLLDWLGQTPEHPLDAAALALPLGMGAAASLVLAIGEIGCLNVLGVTIVLAVFTEVGVLAVDPAASLALPDGSEALSATVASSRAGICDRSVHRGGPAGILSPRQSRR